MKLSYNVTGSERKSLIATISQELNAPTKYLGAPTFAYEVGGYHIDRVGTLTGEDNLDLEAALHIAGFDADGDTREYDEPDTYESGLGGMGALPTPEELEAEAYAELEMKRMAVEAQNVPDHSNRGQYGGDEIPEDWADGMTEEEELGLGRQRRESFQGENGMRSDDCPDTKSDTLTVEFPLKGFNPETLDNLAKLVNAKASLLKAALGTDDLPIKQTADTLQFPWFRGTINAEHAEAYSTLISLLCNTAIQKKRVMAKEKETVDNPKYAMRCFLLSLGFIGDEYKAARKILLSRLEGNSSWKNGKKTEVADSE